ncbi:Imm50 family immunity protein [Streptomyces sp. H27-D2]|uniref:Imm50 family immunity protein n=1 Tax=Streptomyces sp. H27-D2 TaxID=3046304 RepID=UPI002DBAFA1B|nr:Imm50 family immunity protein [Streptomyces sp. H27-D2]MEC4014882.1 Imm50 family immunity protein [Streptomyces sp. H27-D2]
MSTSDWPKFLTEPREIHELFDRPPVLSQCDLFYLHIDERGTSVTLGFDTKHLPDHPLPEWTKGEFNAFEFFLTFSPVTHLNISGWQSSLSKQTRISRSLEGNVSVTITGIDEDLSFQAQSAFLTRARVYLASRSE